MQQFPGSMNYLQTFCISFHQTGIENLTPKRIVLSLNISSNILYFIYITDSF